MSQIIPITYRGDLGYKRSIKDVFDFLSFINWNVEDFLNFKNIDGLTNKEIIYNIYDKKTLLSFGIINKNDDKFVNYNSSSITETMPCPYPIMFHVDSKYVRKGNIISQSSLLVNNFSATDFSKSNEKDSFFYNKNVFYEEIQQLLVNTSRFDSSVDQDVFKRQIEPHVYIWCKSLQKDGKFNNNSIFDLSPFIQSINTNVSKNGGNFSIQLIPIEGLITCSIDGEIDGIWHPKTNQHINFINKNGNSSVETEHYFKTIIHQIYKRYDSFELQSSNNETSDLGNFTFTTGTQRKGWTKMLFENMISENDVVFISYGHPFEKIGLGKNVSVIDDFFIDHNSIVNGQYEMIGLIDTNSISHSPENEDVSISISGRDCMKLLIEDGTYFFAKSYANPNETESAFNNVDLPNQGDSVNAFNNLLSNSSSINRVITNGVIDVFFNTGARNVEYVMNLLISRLANIEICPSQLFEAWGDRRTKFQVVITENVDEKSPIENKFEDN